MRKGKVVEVLVGLCRGRLAKVISKHGNDLVVEFDDGLRFAYATSEVRAK